MPYPPPKPVIIINNNNNNPKLTSTGVQPEIKTRNSRADRSKYQEVSQKQK